MFGILAILFPLLLNAVVENNMKKSVRRTRGTGTNFDELVPSFFGHVDVLNTPVFCFFGNI